MISLDDKREIIEIADEVAIGDISIEVALIHIQGILSNYVTQDRL